MGHFEKGEYPDLSEIKERVKYYIEKHLDDDGAELLLDVVRDFEPVLITDTLTADDINPVVDDLSLSDLEDLQSRVEKLISLKKVGV